VCSHGILVDKRLVCLLHKSTYFSMLEQASLVRFTLLLKSFCSLNFFTGFNHPWYLTQMHNFKVMSQVHNMSQVCSHVTSLQQCHMFTAMSQVYSNDTISKYVTSLKYFTRLKHVTISKLCVTTKTHLRTSQHCHKMTTMSNIKTTSQLCNNVTMSQLN
jgi:hypothetical protein